MTSHLWYAYAFCIFFYVLPINCDSDSLSFILPGTKWCGPGNSSASDDDLGESKDVDMCCRVHDHCPDVINPNETENNITNNSEYLLRSCECEQELYACFEKINNELAELVASLFFNLENRKCFVYDYPQKCVKYSTEVEPRCVEYNAEETKDKEWQKIDLPLFKTKESEDKVVV